MKYKLINSYVYIVYECSAWDKLKSNSVEGKIHGVYINKLEAVGKRWKLFNNPGIEGHIAILKKPVEGKSICRDILLLNKRKKQ